MGKRSESRSGARQPGPRGGTTTRSDSGMVRKNLWLSAQMAELLRQRSFVERRTESDIIREGLKRVLGLKGG